MLSKCSSKYTKKNLGSFYVKANVQCDPTQIIISLKPSVNALIDCHIMSLQPITVYLHSINDLLVSTRYHAGLWSGLTIL